jgi:predicted glycoside hydrolase/deacetylase ChbG (UPF0249 family)
VVKRYLIVNADDFGQSPGINRGVIEAHAHGIVTSASLMVRWPDAVEAAAYSRAHPDLSLGIHLDFGEWAYRDETWIPLYQVVPDADIKAVAEEVSRQFDTFRCLVGADPTHIDSHQHVHREEPIRSALIDVADNMAVPLRDCSPAVQYCGSFYGQTAEGAPLPQFISVEGLISILKELPPGTTELGCHPGIGAGLPETMYRGERSKEVAALCDPQIRTAIVDMGIELRSFNNLSEQVLPHDNSPRRSSKQRKAKGE